MANIDNTPIGEYKTVHYSDFIFRREQDGLTFILSIRAKGKRGPEKYLLQETDTGGRFHWSGLFPDKGPNVFRADYGKVKYWVKFCPPGLVIEPREN
jgi:hypothetical protein